MTDIFDDAPEITEEAVEAQVGQIPSWRKTNREVALEEEIERLLSACGVEDMKHEINEQQAEIKRLKARVEELEKENESLRAKIKFLRNGCHHITDEMIDAAVQWLENIYSDDNPTRLSLSIVEIIKRHLWKLLNKLNIFRCYHLGATQLNGILVGECSDCHGHGWTIGVQK